MLFIITMFLLAVSREIVHCHTFK